MYYFLYYVPDILLKLKNTGLQHAFFQKMANIFLFVYKNILKGQCHEMNNYFESLKIKSILAIYALMVSNFFAP
jgi:hypothetical protein